ncbi:hypothetical protein V3F56_04275 [Moorellaceae bacterium AZ2]
MLVVTITNWRRKLVWLLAALLVGMALLLGQSSLEHTAPSLPASADVKQEMAGEKSGTLKQGIMERLLTKLRQYYQGE